MKTVNLRLFGAFRRYVPSGQFCVRMDEPCSISEFKSLLFDQLMSSHPSFADRQLIVESVLANDTEILSDEVQIVGGESLACLPPVCGG